MESLVINHSILFSVNKGLGCVRVQENELITCWNKARLTFKEPLALAPLSPSGGGTLVSLTPPLVTMKMRRQKARSKVNMPKEATCTQIYSFNEKTCPSIHISSKSKATNGKQQVWE